MSCHHHHGFDPSKRPGPSAWTAFLLGRWLYARRWFHRLFPNSTGLTGLLRHAAEANHAGALSLLGHLFFHRGVSFADRSLGWEYLVRAAELGEHKAEYQVGREVLQGRRHASVPENKARLYLQRSAEAGHVLALRLLEQAH